MPYTTGELAKLCGVSVRTVQYYDERAILVPNELSEGGRRLYGEDAVKRLEIICFLREVGIPINSIAQLFAEEKPENVISLLLEQQEEILRAELSRKYYAPRITRIYSVKERYGFSYWRVDLENTNDFSFTVQDTYRSMLKIDAEHIFIVDVDGNRYEIPSVEQLDRASYKKIELYL